MILYLLHTNINDNRKKNNLPTSNTLYICKLTAQHHIQRQDKYITTTSTSHHHPLLQGTWEIKK